MTLLAPLHLARSALVPELTRIDAIPELNSLRVTPDGKLVHQEQTAECIVSFDHGGHRMTARLSRADATSILLEIGCPIVRMPFRVEGAERRRTIVTRALTWAVTGHGELGITPEGWLYLHDRMLLPAEAMTATWLVTQLTLAALVVAPGAERLRRELVDRG